MEIFALTPSKNNLKKMKELEYFGRLLNENRCAAVVDIIGEEKNDVV